MHNHTSKQNAIFVTDFETVVELHEKWKKKHETSKLNFHNKRSRFIVHSNQSKMDWTEPNKTSSFRWIAFPSIFPNTFERHPTIHCVLICRLQSVCKQLEKPIFLHRILYLSLSLCFCLCPLLHLAFSLSHPASNEFYNNGIHIPICSHLNKETKWFSPMNLSFHLISFIKYIYLDCLLASIGNWN